MNQCSDNSRIMGAKHPRHQLRVITNNLAPFRGSTNPNSCNTHIQTPCPENHRFGDSTVQTSNTVIQPYVSTVAQTSGICLYGQK